MFFLKFSKFELMSSIFFDLLLSLIFFLLHSYPIIDMTHL